MPNLFYFICAINAIRPLGQRACYYQTRTCNFIKTVSSRGSETERGSNSVGYENYIHKTITCPKEYFSFFFSFYFVKYKENKAKTKKEEFLKEPHARVI